MVPETIVLSIELQALLLMGEKLPRGEAKSTFDGIEVANVWGDGPK